MNLAWNRNSTFTYRNLHKDNVTYLSSYNLFVRFKNFKLRNGFERKLLQINSKITAFNV